MCIHQGLVVYYLWCGGGGGELFWESLEDFQNNLQFILATLDKIACILGKQCSCPWKQCSCVFKRKSDLWAFVGSNFELGEGLTLCKAIDLERVLLYKIVRIEEKMFSSSFVRDCNFLKVTLNQFQLLWKWLTHIWLLWELQKLIF